MQQDTELDDTEHERVWEPYTFEVGDTVRIKLSPECSLRPDHIILNEETDKINMFTTKKKGHDQIYNNQLGIVVQVTRHAEQLGHYYRVATILHKEYKDKVSLGSDFACLELEPADFTVTYDHMQNVLIACEIMGCTFPSLR